MVLRQWGKGDNHRRRRKLMLWLRVVCGLVMVVAGWLLLLWFVGELMSYQGGGW